MRLEINRTESGNGQPPPFSAFPSFVRFNCVKYCWCCRHKDNTRPFNHLGYNGDVQADRNGARLPA